VEDTRRGAGGLPAGALLWLAALWVWVIPSAWFWGLAESQGILLPHVPHYLWAGPGELWIASPWLFAGVCLALSGGIAAAARRWPGLARETRILAWVVAIASIAIHALWGGAILSQ
jgi:hypothetical protein